VRKVDKQAGPTGSPLLVADETAIRARCAVFAEPVRFEAIGF
jgi:hypothetical protein